MGVSLWPRLRLRKARSLVFGIAECQPTELPSLPNLVPYQSMVAASGKQMGPARPERIPSGEPRGDWSLVVDLPAGLA